MFGPMAVSNMESHTINEVKILSLLILHPNEDHM